MKDLNYLSISFLQSAENTKAIKENPETFINDVLQGCDELRANETFYKHSGTKPYLSTPVDLKGTTVVVEIQPQERPLGI